MMGRKRFAADYSNRSRYLVLLAAIVLVGCVPFGYANKVAGILAMITAAAIALLSTIADAVISVCAGNIWPKDGRAR